MTLAVLSGCDRDALDDRDRVEVWLRAMVEAGGFTLFSLEVTRFVPQGVTGMAVVGESHLAVHTWPEEGRLFLDIASCTTKLAADRAIAALRELCAHDDLVVESIDYDPRSGFGAEPRRAWVV